MQRAARTFTLAFAAVVAVVAFGLLALGTDAATGTAEWSCGSVLQPKRMGFPKDRPEVTSEVFFLQGQVACGEAREARLGRAIGMLVPAALFAVIVLRAGEGGRGSTAARDRAGAGTGASP